jgi:glycosyltransferase involved in cell wall biosynthesis
MPATKLTVITPVYNEEAVLPHFHLRTRAVLKQLPNVDGRILYVIDRCTDNSENVLRQIVASDPLASAIVLSSRFGHQMSLLAGVDHAGDSDAIVMMDSDLQHPPEIIPELLDRYRAGYDIVYTIRDASDDVGRLRAFLGDSFYRLLSSISKTPINANAADFRLISGRVARTLSDGFPERNMFMRGLFSWMGFRQIGVRFRAEKRFAGRSKYSLARMMQLATAGILSFSTKPLQFGIYVGFLCALAAFLMLVLSMGAYFFDSTIPSGWTTLVALLLLFSGLQLVFMGILGTYIGGIYEEVKGRPRYIVAETIQHHVKSATVLQPKILHHG